jgi:hypothetical protein
MPAFLFFDKKAIISFLLLLGAPFSFCKVQARCAPLCLSTKLVFWLPWISRIEAFHKPVAAADKTLPIPSALSCAAYTGEKF